VGGLHHPLRCFTRVILQEVAIPSQQVLSYNGRGLTDPGPSLCLLLSDFPVEPACSHLLNKRVRMSYVSNS